MSYLVENPKDRFSCDVAQVSHTMRENLSSEVCNQVRLKPSAQLHKLASLEIWGIVSVCIKLPRERITKMLIRLHGCAG